MHQLLIITLISFSLSALGQDKGLDIAKKINLANKGFKSEASEIKMILISGKRRIERQMVSKTLEVGADDTKSLMEFILPKDVAGTKLLTWSYKAKDDAQWIFLNAFNRVKRISSSSKSSSFMGSEFTFEDLRAAVVDKFTYKFIREEKKGDDTLWVFEKYPKNDSTYSKQVVTASKKYMNTIKVDFYSKNKSLLKVGTFSKFKKFDIAGKTMWRASLISMKNVQTLRESELEIITRKLGAKINEREFTKRNLKQ